LPLGVSFDVVRVFSVERVLHRAEAPEEGHSHLGHVLELLKLGRGVDQLEGDRLESKGEGVLALGWKMGHGGPVQTEELEQLPTLLLGGDIIG
jgi:hypothetical protein